MLGISERTVRRKAEKEGWEYREERKERKRSKKKERDPTRDREHSHFCGLYTTQKPTPLTQCSVGVFLSYELIAFRVREYSVAGTKK